MKNILVVILLLFSFAAQSQEIMEIKNKAVTCCQHLDEEYGETWTILYEASDILDAQRLIDRYDIFDIANDYFESDGFYYIELVDPTDTLEIKGNFKLFTNKHKKRLIFIDFLVTDNNEPLFDENGNNIMFM